MIQKQISPSHVIVDINPVKWIPYIKSNRIPQHIAIVLARTGTLSGKSGLVMADEAMAHGLCSGLKIASGWSLKCDVVAYDEIPTDHKYDSMLIMHHTVLNGLPSSSLNIPKWLWVHNPGISSAVELKKHAYSTYQRIFHAGKAMADACGFTHLPHALESIEYFSPSNDGDLYDIGFVGNFVMHRDLCPLLERLERLGKRLEIRGAGWREFSSISSSGPIDMSEAKDILARSSVCIDHVSYQHTCEGMTSTRVYQVLACESALVSLQSPNNIPEPMRKHILFARDNDEAFSMIRKLLSDPIARAKLCQGSRKSVARETMLERARVIWSSMITDIN